jgi:hypothetical protein
MCVVVRVMYRKQRAIIRNIRRIDQVVTVALIESCIVHIDIQIFMFGIKGDCRLCVTSGFCCNVNEVFTVQGCYRALAGS